METQTSTTYILKTWETCSKFWALILVTAAAFINVDIYINLLLLFLDKGFEHFFQYKTYVAKDFQFIYFVYFNVMLKRDLVTSVT